MRISDWSSDVCSSDLEKAAKSFDSLRDLIVADCVLEAYDHRAQIRDRPIGHRARGAINCGNVERGSQFDCAHCWSPPRSFMIVMARRSEERRVGKACGRSCSTRWSTTNSKTNQQ